MFDLENLEDLIEYTQKLNLLYVEDNPDAKDTTLIVLKDFFNNITVATNGEEGLEKFKQNDIDLIITDINMPKLNGLDMIKEIRKIDSETLIFVLSAYNESGFFIDSIKLGVEGYLLKPIEINQFLSILNKVVSKIKLKEEAKAHMHFLKEYEDLTNSSAIVSKADTNGNITFVNKNFCKLTEYSEEELIGKNHNIIRHPDMQKELFDDMWETIKNKKQLWNGIIKILSKNGKSFYVDATVKPILDKNGNLIEYIALRKDITDIMNPKKQLSDVIKNSKNPIVIYMKLEEYDTLEELYDADTIEKIQDKVTKYLEDTVKKICHFEKVFQLGNGEFAITAEKTLCIKDSEEDFLRKLKLFQEDIKKDKVDVGEIDYDISIMISVAYDCDKVLESALLGIKKLLKGKSDFIISNNLAQKELENAKQNIKSISMIKNAILNLKIVSYFQPIINNYTLEIEKYESLVRLIDEDENILSPFHFLDIAKKSKYYAQITNIVLENSFFALENTDKEISINLSAMDIEQKRTRDKIFALLDKYHKYNHKVVFELLEDESVKDFNIIKKFISEVKQLGVKIAIDDFGAGYSNFERLVDFSPDILKIDGCLTKDITTNPYSLSVVKTIVSFAKEQGIKTVAEFVENQKIFETLKGLGVDYSQGYYFGKPLEINKILT